MSKISMMGLGMVLLVMTGCATGIGGQPITIEDAQALMRDVNGSGCLSGTVAGAGIGGARLALTWGQDISDDARRYCFGGF
jgi:hydroxyethylthiazole kinase-like sugar kinase family protein